MRVTATGIAGSALVTAVMLCPAYADTSTVKGTITWGSAPGTPLADAVVMVQGPSMPLTEGAPRVRMAQRNDTFVPRVLAVATGTTVDFPNDDSRLHNVLSTSPAKPFDLGMYGRGESKSVTFETPGLVHVRCADHPRMEGFVLVHANPYLAVTDRQGAYTITAVPPGRYRVRVWHEKGEREVWATTSAGQVATLDVRLTR